MDARAGSMDLLAKLMTAAEARHRVIASNVANAGTPNYLARVYRFEEGFREALGRGDVDAALGMEGEIATDESAPVRADGNSVSLEKELGELQKNQLAYGFLADALRHKLVTMQRAIAGRA